MKTMFSKFSFSKALLISLSLFVTHAANAELTQVSVLIDASNECGKNGYFTNNTKNGFSDCKITVQDDDGVNQYLNDIIVKYDGDLSWDETSENYKNKLANDDFKFTGTTDTDNGTNTNVEGTWVYNNKQYKYPDIRFWTAKSGDDFLLFWQVDSNEVPSNCTDGTSDDNLSFACMSLAQSVTTGSWTTPSGTSLSHISFFGGLCKEGETRAGCGGTTTTQVPEPTTLALFGLAIMGLSLQRKRKS